MATPVAYLCQCPADHERCGVVYRVRHPKTFANFVAVNATGGAVTLSLSVHRSLSGEVEPICDTAVPPDSLRGVAGV